MLVISIRLKSKKCQLLTDPGKDGCGNRLQGPPIQEVSGLVSEPVEDDVNPFQSSE